MRWLAAVIGLAIAASFPAAFGHGFGGAQAPPLDLNGREGTGSTLLHLSLIHIPGPTSPRTIPHAGL